MRPNVFIHVEQNLCLHSRRTKNKLELHIKVCECTDFCNAVMSLEDSKILEFNQHFKSDKASFI